MAMRAAGVLAGIRVLDFTEWLPGPYATKMLAALGAEVIKVERPGTGDPARTARPAMFGSQNEGKRSVALDLKSPDGAERARRLADEADVLIEGYRPGVMARLGLGAEALAPSNPGLIYVSLSGYGSAGPYRDRPGHDLNYLALAGALPAPAPGGAAAYRETPLPIADLAGGLFAVIGILTALLAGRAGQDRGGRLDLAIADCALSLMQPRIAEAAAWRDTAAWHERPGYGIFETADDRFVVLGALEDHFFRRLVAALELPQFQQPGFATYAQRRGQVAAIDAALRARIAELPLDRVLARLNEADVPADAVADMLDPLRDQHFRARGMVVPGADGRETVSPWPGALRRFMVGDRLPAAPELGLDDRDLVAGWQLPARSQPAG
jgi:crotonobetainyl-CoA:carnitine CoA-transferase CaiB-like acyl-CoA transferase